MYSCMYVCMYVCINGWMDVCLLSAGSQLPGHSTDQVEIYVGMYVCMYVCMYLLNCT